VSCRSLLVLVYGARSNDSMSVTRIRVMAFTPGSQASIAYCAMSFIGLRLDRTRYGNSGYPIRYAHDRRACDQRSQGLIASAPSSQVYLPPLDQNIYPCPLLILVRSGVFFVARRCSVDYPGVGSGSARMRTNLTHRFPGCGPTRRLPRCPP
jgi:hypothetical protein